MTLPRLYAITDDVRLSASYDPEPRAFNFRTVTTPPYHLHILDLRRRAVRSLDDAHRVVQDWYARKGQPPRKIRLNRMQKRKFGNPTTLWGIKVTL